MRMVGKRQSPNLRPASELQAERAARTAFDARRDEAGLARAVTLIEEAHARGESYVSGLAFSPWVVKELEAAGYKVKLQGACGMGDMDTHRIEW